MRTRTVLGMVALAGLLGACGASAEPPAAPMADTTRATATKVAATPTGEVAPTASMQAPPAQPGTPDGNARPLRAADVLDKLPPGAGLYLALRPGDLFPKGDASALPEEIVRELRRGLGGDDFTALFEDGGVDPRGTIVGALVPASETSARAVVDAMIAGTSGAALDKVRAAHAGDATRARFLVPLKPGADVARTARTLAALIAPGGTVEACPAASACAGFTAIAPLVVARSPHVAAVLSADGSDLRVEVVMPLFTAGTDPAALAGLVALQGVRGGPQGTCSRFDPGASISLCADAAGSGAMGATTGYGKVVAALEGEGINPAQKKKIAAFGRAEAMRNLELAAPSRKLASDGTSTTILTAGQPRVIMSWALTDRSRPGLEKAFATERCVAGTGVLVDLLPAIRVAVGDPGKEFADPKQTYERFREAGWGAFPVALSGTWMNLLNVTTTPAAKAMEVPASLQVCARTEGGRLTLTMHPAP